MITILLVDDEPKTRDMLRKFMELQNYSVVTSADGKSGLETAKRIMPDIIISDVMMPGMDGYSFKAALKTDPAYATIPFIFLTSMKDYKDVRKGMELGADDYLAKPVKLEDLSKAIKTQLAKRNELLADYSKKLKQEPKHEYNESEHILIKDKGLPRFIKVATILCILADEKYTRVCLETGEKVIVSIAVKEWEGMLPESVFVRIHRSAIINVGYIEKVDKWFQRGYRVKIKGIPEPLEISRRYYSKMTDLFAG